MASAATTAENGRILVIVNPRAGRRRRGRVDRILRALGGEASRITVVRTQSSGDARRAVAAAPPDTVLVVAAGGDGTVGEALSGMDGRDLPLAVVPLGTSNILARALGLPRDIAGACRLARQGHWRRLDTGRTGRGRFVGVASAGFDAAVIHAFARRRSGHSSLAAYLGPIWRTLRSYRFPRIAVECDGRPVTERATQVIIANIRSYGGPFVPAPAARPDDGLLDVCILRPSGAFGLVLCALLSVVRAHLLLPGVRVLRARRVRCTSEEEVPVQLDGDAHGTLPLTCEIEAGALRLAAPQVPSGA